MKKTTTALIILGLAATVGFANAASHADPVAARQALMKDQGAQAKILGTIAQGTFDAEAVKAAATKLHEDALKIPATFEENVTNADSRALPKIWEDPAGYAAESEKLVAAAMMAMNATDQASLATAMQAVGASCQSCHQAYRAPSS
jgi:cytochrome c556